MSEDKAPYGKQKLLIMAEFRDLEKQVLNEEISISRMVEIINQKHESKIAELKSVAEEMAAALQNVLNIFNPTTLWLKRCQSALEKFNKLKENE